MIGVAGFVILALALAFYGALKVRDDVRARNTELIVLGAVVTGGGTVVILWAAYMIAMFIRAGGL